MFGASSFFKKVDEIIHVEKSPIVQLVSWKHVRNVWHNIFNEGYLAGYFININITEMLIVETTRVRQRHDINLLYQIL